MTMESTELHEGATGDGTPYPLDPLTGAEIESAAAIITDSEYCSPTTKFVMIQLAEPDKNAELTLRRSDRRTAAGIRHDVRRRGEDDLRGSRRPDGQGDRLVDADPRPVPVLSRRAHDGSRGEGQGGSAVAGGHAQAWRH